MHNNPIQALKSDISPQIWCAADSGSLKRGAKAHLAHPYRDGGKTVALEVLEEISANSERAALATDSLETWRTGCRPGPSGRPRTSPEIEDLVVRLARALRLGLRPDGGSVGQPGASGVRPKVSDRTIGNILRRREIALCRKGARRPLGRTSFAGTWTFSPAPTSITVEVLTW
jgi:hypothetical protein